MLSSGSEVGMAEPPRVVLRSVEKRYTRDQDKAAHPASTVEHALGRLRAVAGDAELAIEARPTPIADAFTFGARAAGIATSGKGLGSEQARASAVMELCERYAWLHFDYESRPDFVFASHDSLVERGARVVAREYFGRNFVGLDDPASFVALLARTPLKWIAATSLGDGEPTLYPVSWHNLVFSSNGLAAGNCLEEAVLQALCEVVERENVYRLFVEGRRGVALDLGSIAHPLVTRVLEQARGAGIELEVIDVTGELGIPTFVARGRIAAEAGLLTAEGVGHGCHTDPEKAVMRALSEYFEGLEIMRRLQATLGPGVPGIAELLPPAHLGFLARLRPEVLEPGPERRRLADIPRLARDDLRDEVELVTGLLRARGLSVLVAHKTHAALGIPTVRVVVPEMRSCLNTEVRSPDFAVSAALYEAGDRAASRVWWRRAVDALPVLAMLRRIPLTGEVAEALVRGANREPRLGTDYLETIRAFVKDKSAGMRTLAGLAGVEDALPLVLRALGRR